MSDTYDVVVVGGGVVGCAVACELAERGARVALLERDRIGSGTSGAAAGMLAPQSEAHADDEWFRMLLAGRAEHEPLACRLRHETALDVGYRRDGVVKIALTEEERAELQARGEWQRAAGLAAEWLEPDEACKLEPSLSPEIAGALWLPDEAQVHAPRLVQALGLLAGRRGVAIHEGTPAVAVEPGAVRTTADRIATGAVVLAAGVWTGSLSSKLPVEPVKGQIVRGYLGPACSPKHIVWGPGAYLVPKSDGGLLVGATEEPGVSDPRPTLGAIASLIQAGARLLPSLAHVPLSHAWAGLRPALPDRRPAIGRVAEGLFAATGHYRNGILLGPLTGKLLAREILGS